MSPQEFIENLVSELDLRNELYSPDNAQNSEVAARIRKLGLTPEQEAELMSILRLALAETVFGFLCGLEGTGSIGQSQGSYRLADESGKELTGKLDNLFFERVMS